MTSKKKKIGNGIFLAAVFILTIYSVFHGEDLGAVLKAIVRVNPWYLLPGCAGVIIFIWGESIIIHYMLGTLNIRTKEEDLFPVFLHRILFQLYHTVRKRGAAHADLLYEKK